MAGLRMSGSQGPGTNASATTPIADLHPILQQIASLRARYSVLLAVTAAFCVPLKLSFTYIALTPLVLLWIFGGGLNRRSVSPREPGATLLIFLGVTACVSLFGFNPLYSVWKTLGAALFVCTVFAIRDIADRRVRWKLLIAICLGQSIAALHTVLQSGFPDLIPPMFVGRVTESGQLALTVIVTLGMILAASIGERKLNETTSSVQLIQTWISGLFLTVLSITIAFGSFDQPSHSPYQTIILVGFSLFLALGAYSVIKLLKSFSSGDLQFKPALLALVGLIMPLLLAALCINLKRGPWLGVLIGAAVLLATYRPKLVLILLLLALSVGLGVEPVRERLAESSAHFFIYGGRSEMWDIGLDLMERYPFGVGAENSPILQKFSPEIPSQLRHFHSNLINVGAEVGILGLSVFAWAIIVCIRYGFRVPRNDLKSSLNWPIAYGISCAILAWQVAGLVEYNFGDSEVKLLAFMLLGIVTRMVNDLDVSKPMVTITNPLS